MKKLFLALACLVLLTSKVSAGTLAPLDVPPSSIVVQTASFNAVVLSTNLVDSTAGAVVCTLPDATQCQGRAIVVFCKVHGSGHNVTFAATASQTVNGAAATSLTALSAANTGYVLLSDGSNWFALSGLLAQ